MHRLFSKAVDNWSTPVQHRVVFDLDNCILIELPKDFSFYHPRICHTNYENELEIWRSMSPNNVLLSETVEHVTVSDEAKLSSTTPSCSEEFLYACDIVIATEESKSSGDSSTKKTTYHLLFPNIDLLILSILSWPHWSVDFYSNTSHRRNQSLVKSIFTRCFGKYCHALGDIPLDKTMKPLPFDGKAGLIESYFEAFQTAGRLQIKSWEDMRKLTGYNDPTSSRYQVEPSKYSVKKDLSVFLPQPPLTILVPLEPQPQSVELEEGEEPDVQHAGTSLSLEVVEMIHHVPLDEIILVDDYQKNVIETQKPFVHLPLGKCDYDCLFSLDPILGKTTVTWRSEWKTNLQLHKRKVLVLDFQGNLIPEIFQNANYVMGLLCKAKELIMSSSCEQAEDNPNDQENENMEFKSDDENSVASLKAALTKVFESYPLVRDSYLVNVGIEYFQSMHC